MAKIWYKYKYFWRRGDGDEDHSPLDRDDGTGDLIWNTLTKIIIDEDKSEWAISSFIECARPLRERNRWTDDFNTGMEAPNRIIWYVFKFLGIKKYTYRSQDDMTRDPYVAFGACYAHLLKSSGGMYDEILKATFESVKIPFYVYRPKTWAWWRRKGKDNRPHYVKRISYFRALGDKLWFEKYDEDDFYKDTI